MHISNGVELLELSANIRGITVKLYPTIIKDSDTVILVDTGYPGQLSQIKKAMEKSGVPFPKLNKIILTHHDYDHMGVLPDILNEMPVEVIAHIEEKPYIDGTKRSIRFDPQWVEQLKSKHYNNDETKGDSKIFEAFFENTKIKVDKTVTDNMELPYCGGIAVIHTPGHTLGHICLYLRQSKTLIAGDELVLSGGILKKTLHFFDYDSDLSKKSLKKLTEYDIETVICYHGGLYRKNVNQRIAELAAATHT